MVTEDGCKVLLFRDFLWMYDRNGQLLMKVQRSSNRLYKILLHSTAPVCLAVSLDEAAWLWHARLGYLNFQAMKQMVAKNMVRGVPNITHPTQLCEACLVGKKSRLSFPVQAQYRANKPLELVHADLCGPITPQTSAGNRYFFLLVDDFSRFMWVYVIKTKDEALVAFKKFKVQVENKTSFKVKTLRTDRGGEFVSQCFSEFCEAEGIQRQLTAPYTPQQNGVVERRNRSVLGTTRSLLKAIAVPQTMWGEGVRHAVYLLNRVPTKAVKDITPYEAWNGRKPDLEHLKVFGCTAHVKVPSARMTKLDDRSRPMVYLGVEPGSKAHRLYDPQQGKICVSRDVAFEENRKWNWTEDHGNINCQGSEWVEFIVSERSESALENASVTEDEPVAVGVPTSPAPHSLVAGPSSSTPLCTPDSSTYDDTPVRGFRSLADVYARA